MWLPAGGQQAQQGSSGVGASAGALHRVAFVVTEVAQGGCCQVLHL